MIEGRRERPGPHRHPGLFWSIVVLSCIALTTAGNQIVP